MRIDGIGAGAGAAGLPLAGTGGSEKAAGGSFTDMLDSLVGDLQNMQQTSDNAVASLATGGDVDIAEVVMATEAESLAFNLLLGVRNKLLEGYQEIFRMQV